MNDFDLDLNGKTTFQPGETMTGTIRWVLEKTPRSVEVVLFWRTLGKGTTDSGVVAREVWENPESYGEKSFTFQVPHAPLSFSGQLITLQWEVEAIAHKAKKQTHTSIIISPTGQEIILGDPLKRASDHQSPKWVKWLKRKFGSCEGEE